MVVQADFVYRKMLHGTPGGFFGASVDFNRFNSIEGPVIPACTAAAQANDPTAQCSSGPINFWWPGAEAEYKALLLKVGQTVLRPLLLHGVLRAAGQPEHPGRLRRT